MRCWLSVSLKKCTIPFLQSTCSEMISSDTIELGRSQSGRFSGCSLPPSFILISRHFCNFSKSPNSLFLIICFLSQHFIFESCSLLLAQTVQLGTYLFSHPPEDSAPQHPEFQNTRCAWAGGTFFPVVLLCQFFGSGGK